MRDFLLIFRERFRIYWRSGYRARIEFLILSYPIYTLPIILPNGIYHFLSPLALMVHSNLILVSLGFNLRLGVRAYREMRIARKNWIEARDNLRVTIENHIGAISQYLSFNCRPSVVELSRMAELVYDARRLKIRTHTVELALIEGWVTYWDGEKVKQ